MVKKLTGYIFLFFLLIAINTLLCVKLIHKTQKQQATQRILEELNGEYNPAKQFSRSAAPLVLGAYETSIEVKDARVANLKIFFRKFGSPLYDYADKIVEVSDRYQFDYRLLPAIAMQESGLCRVIPNDSHNCWGWGIYGNVVTRFDSYDEAIETVSKGIKKEYIDKGLITASAIMQKYTPSSSGSWAYAVNTFLRALE